MESRIAMRAPLVGPSRLAHRHRRPGSPRERAESVSRFLSELGVDSSHISAMGKGEEQPVATNDTNRRAEIVVADVRESEPDDGR